MSEIFEEIEDPPGDVGEAWAQAADHRDEFIEHIAVLDAELEAARGALSYLRTQARNGTLHPQVVIQNATKVLGDE
jgi:hypothetical protein